MVEAIFLGGFNVESGLGSCEEAGRDVAVTDAGLHGVEHLFIALAVIDLELRGYVIAVVGEGLAGIKANADDGGAVGETAIVARRIANELRVGVTHVLLHRVENILVVSGEDEVVEFLHHGGVV